MKMHFMQVIREEEEEQLEEQEGTNISIIIQSDNYPLHPIVISKSAPTNILTANNKNHQEQLKQTDQVECGSD